MKNYIHRFLLSYNCPPDYLGFGLLSDALEYACQNLPVVNNNFKCIYCEVAERNKITRLCIERNLRTLISVWSKDPKFAELFPQTPTNAKLIMTLAYRIALPKSSVYDILLY